MRELLQGRKRLLVAVRKDALMRLNTSEVEGYHAIEEDSILRKVVGILRRIAQSLSDRRGCLGHVCILLARWVALAA